MLALQYLLSQTIAAWAVERADLLLRLLIYAREPITESKYARLIEEERSRSLSLDAATEVVKTAREPDVDQGPGDGPVTSEQIRAELVHAIEVGQLSVEGGGEATELAAGALYDWLGIEAPVWPERYCIEFDVRGDAEQERVEREREALLAVFERGARGPSDRATTPDGADEENHWDARARELQQLVVRGYQQLRRQLLVLEELTEELSGQFGAEIADEEQQRALRGTRSLLDQLGPWLREQFGVEEPEADKHFADELRRAIAREQRR